MTCSYLIILSQQLLLLKCVYLPSLLFPGRSNSLSRRRLLVHCLCPAIAVSEWRHRRRKALLLKQETPSFSCQLHCKTISSTTSQCHVYSCPAAACPTAAAVFLSSATLNEITFLLLLCASFIPAGFRCSVFFNFSLAQVWNIKWEHDLTSHTPYAGRAIASEERPKRHGLNQRSRNCISSSTSTSSSYSLLLSPSELCRVVFASCQG